MSLFPYLKFYIKISPYTLLDLLPTNATYHLAPSSIEYLKYPSEVVPLVVTPTEILPYTMLIATYSDHSPKPNHSPPSLFCPYIVTTYRVLGIFVGVIGHPPNYPPRTLLFCHPQLSK